MHNIRNTKKVLAIALSLAMAIPAGPALAEESQATGATEAIVAVEQAGETQGDAAAEALGAEAGGQATIVERAGEAQGDQAIEAQGAEADAQAAGSKSADAKAADAKTVGIQAAGSQAAGIQAADGQAGAGAADGSAKTDDATNAAIDTWAALQKAIDEAPDGTPTTITLAQDLVGDKDIVIPAGKDITIEMAGHTLKQKGKGQRVISNNGTLTLTSNGEGKARIEGAGSERPNDMGAGLHNAEGASLTVENCLITNCYSGKAGGGVYNSTGAFLVMRNCEISHCGNGERCCFTTGGGIHSDGDVKLSGVDIHDNSANKGAGIYMTYHAPLSLDGCRIRDNKATDEGGGIYLGNECWFSMKDTSIEGNSALYAADGIEVLGVTDAHIEGTIIVRGNGVTGKTRCEDVCVPSILKFVITGPLAEDTEIHVDAEYAAKDWTLTRGFDKHNPGKSPRDFFFVDDDNREVRTDLVNGEAELIGAMCSWEELTKFLNDTRGAEVGYLGKDLTAGKKDGALSVPAGRTVRLELCGHTIDRGLKKAADHGGVIENEGELTLVGGTVKGGKTTGNGGGIYNKGTLALEGVKVAGNMADGKGGGVYSSGALNLYGTTEVSENQAKVGGGVCHEGERLGVGDAARVTCNDGGDLFLAKGGKISVDRTLVAGALFDVALEDGGVITSGYGEHNGDIRPDCFFQAGGKLGARLTGDGEVEIGAFDIEAPRPEETGLATCGCGVKLGESLDLTYHVRDLKDSPDFYTIEWSTGKGVPTVQVLGSREDNEFVLASYAPDHMGDTVHVVVRYWGSHGGETIVEETDCSVKGYCEAVIADPSIAGGHGEEAAELCKAVLDYGSRTQLETGYRKDQLVNGGEFFFGKGSIKVPAAKSERDGECEGIEGFSAKLSCGSKVTLVGMFAHDEDAQMADYSFYVDDKAADVYDVDGFFEVRAEGISATDLDQCHTFRVERDGETFEVTTSPVSYLSVAIKANVAADFNRALLNYHQKAKAFAYPS